MGSSSTEPAVVRALWRHCEAQAETIARDVPYFTERSISSTSTSRTGNPSRGPEIYNHTVTGKSCRDIMGHRQRP